MYEILALIRPPSKPVYGIHDRKVLTILTQLRVGLSKLNFHNFKHNFSDAIDPMCPANDGVGGHGTLPAVLPIL